MDHLMVRIGGVVIAVEKYSIVIMRTMFQKDYIIQNTMAIITVMIVVGGVNILKIIFQIA